MTNGLRVRLEGRSNDGIGTFSGCAAARGLRAEIGRGSTTGAPSNLLNPSDIHPSGRIRIPAAPVDLDLPAGEDADGMPIGVQAIGPFMEDLTPIRLAELATAGEPDRAPAGRD